ncbi:hypothetical protein MJM99_32805, partial [Salmonella enterica subsp. enterica serovar Kentucky]|nr:hypothetical protein [Salmonella enterica subsp. enterica serovar Kentucky]
DDYFTVQQYITSAFKTVLIGIVTHNEYNFIDEHHAIYRIKVDESLFLPRHTRAWDLIFTLTENCLARQSVECHRCQDSCEPMAI